MVKNGWIVAMSWQIFGVEKQDGAELAKDRGRYKDDWCEQPSAFADSIGKSKDAWSYDCFDDGGDSE